LWGYFSRNNGIRKSVTAKGLLKKLLNKVGLLQMATVLKKRRIPYQNKSAIPCTVPVQGILLCQPGPPAKESSVKR